MPNFKLTTPVVLIMFSKLDTADRVFSEIAKAKPTKLLVISDAARSDKPGEAAKVAATRAIIQRVDWECEVLTHFSDVNLGPRHRNRAASTGRSSRSSQRQLAYPSLTDEPSSQAFASVCQAPWRLPSRFDHPALIALLLICTPAWYAALLPFSAVIFTSP